MDNNKHIIKNGCDSFIFVSNRMELYSTNSFNEEKLAQIKGEQQRLADFPVRSNAK